MNEESRTLFSKFDKLESRLRRVEIVLAVLVALSFGAQAAQFLG